VLDAISVELSVELSIEFSIELPIKFSVEFSIAGLPYFCVTSDKGLASTRCNVIDVNINTNNKNAM